ncbi:MAG: response regulator [bacterium]
MSNEVIKVLLADDEEEYVSALAERLTLRGLEVRTALRGEDAISFLTEEEFQVAVIDYMMPDLSGLEILKKAKEKNPCLQVIILTGRGSTREGIEGMQLGAFDYLMKPVDIETLIGRIRSASAKSNET